MNYRHAFHAGGFADVVKHAVMTRILVHLLTKPAAFRVLDTHAGAGLYNLSSIEAGRTNEWRDGIGKLYGQTLSAAAENLIKPYRTVLGAFNRGERLVTYPGSPAIARTFLRPQDRLVACEAEPQTAKALARNMRGDERVKIVAIDGWTALGAYVPPKERRGLVVIDPAFEQTDEFDRLAEKFAAAHRKWATGIYLMWYPLKDRAQADRFAHRLAQLAIPKILRAELTIDTPRAADRLSGCGLAIANPPWTLENDIAILFPALSSLLGRDGKGSFRCGWLTGEI